jgi:hypothetical protein
MLSIMIMVVSLRAGASHPAPRRLDLAAELEL